MSQRGCHGRREASRAGDLRRAHQNRRHTLDADAQLGVVSNGSLQVSDRTLFALIGQHLHERDPRGIVDANMDELPPDAAVTVDGAVGEIEMNADPKRKTHKGDYDRAKEARRHQEEALDDALKNTFPASDPVSIGQPTPPAVDHDG
jgi:hypothetical protein